MAGYGDRPFGLNQIRLVRGVTVVTLAVSRTLQFNPRMLTGELAGSDALREVASTIEALEWSIEEGGVPLEAWALMTGLTATETGTTPTRVLTLPGDAATAMPYFSIYGKALGVGIDDIHVLLPNCKLTGNIEGSFSYGEFYMTGISGIAVQRGTADLFTIVQNETAAALPSS